MCWLLNAADAPRLGKLVSKQDLDHPILREYAQTGKFDPPRVGHPGRGRMLPHHIDWLKDFLMTRDATLILDEMRDRLMQRFSND